MKNKINNQSGFTLIELYIIIPLPIVICWEVGLVILKNYSLNNWFIYLSIPLGIVLGIILFVIFVQTYAHQKKYKSLSLFLTLIYWSLVLALLYILPEYFLKDTKYYIINAITALPILVILSFSVPALLKKNK